MSNEPCQEEYARMIQAGEEWERASKNAARFAVTEPLDPSHDIIAKPIEYGEEMGRAFQNEEAAKNKYKDAVKTYIDCVQRHSPK